MPKTAVLLGRLFKCVIACGLHPYQPALVMDIIGFVRKYFQGKMQTCDYKLFTIILQ